MERLLAMLTMPPVCVPVPRALAFWPSVMKGVVSNPPETMNTPVP